MAVLEAAASGCLPVLPSLPGLRAEVLDGCAYYEPQDRTGAAARVVEALGARTRPPTPPDIADSEQSYAELYAEATAHQQRSMPSRR